MFKKTLTALALGTVFSASAFAADVAVYGLVDYGFQYKNIDELKASDSVDTFSMKSGMNSGSRFGLKGTEELGNGLKIGFVLENGFNADDGSFGNSDRLFDREASLYIEGRFGKLAFGRVGQLASANGSWGQLGNFSVFGGGWGSFTGGKYTHGGAWGRIDNAISYATPELAGLKVLAQYSFMSDSQEDHGTYGTSVEGKNTSDRNAAIAVTYNLGNLNLIALGQVDWWSDLKRANGGWANRGDGYLGMLGATYDFGVMKIYADGQYFKRLRTKDTTNLKVTGLNGDFDCFVKNTAFVDGYAFNIGADVPAFGGTFKGNFGYRYAECVVNPTGNNDDHYAISLGYTYDLSPKTTLYTAGTYAWSDLNSDHAKNYTNNVSPYTKDPKAYELFAGMIHRF